MHAFPAGLGRRSDLDAELAQLGDPDVTGARVVAQHRGAWVIATDGDPPRLATARGRLREDDGGPPVTGDWVAVDAAGAIAAVLVRRGAIVRRAAGKSSRPQVLAANVDLALVTEPLPDPHERRAERLVALASAGGVRAALILTKADLAEDADRRAAGLARRLGLLDAVAVSTRAEATGLGGLRTLLVPGTTAVLLGSSGAGKSTLVNALLGEARQAVGTIRASDGRGRHTTVGRELFGLPTGGLLIDTPGVREAGLWDGAGDVFADIDALAAGCRFADCAHAGEPGCAVQGMVDPDRIEAWRKLQREQAWIDDRREAARERERRGRSYKRVQREARRTKGG